MNTIGTTQNQDTVNTLLANTADLVRNLAKPSGSMQTAPASSFLKLPDEVLTLLVNLIKELSRGSTGTKSADVATGAGGLSKPEGGILNSPSLPSFTGSVTTSTTSTPSATGNSGERTLNVAPLPSLVSPTTGSLSTTELPKAFNPPAIPSLLGGSTSLPTVNAVAGSSVSAGLSTASAESGSTGRTLNVAPLPSLISPTTGSLSTTELPKAFNPPAIPSLLGGSTSLPTVNAAASESEPATIGLTTASAESGATGRTLNVAPLPSLVSPTTGSLSTTELPKAFNPPAIPSLLGNTTSLPTVNASASETAPVTTGLALSTAPLPSLVSPTTGSLSTTELPKAFNPPAIPSLLGNSTTLPTVNAATSAIGSNGTSGASSSGIFVPSLTGNATLSALSSADGFSAAGASGIVDGSSTSTSNDFGNHFK